MIKVSQSNALLPALRIASAGTPSLAEPGATTPKVESAWMYLNFPDQTACSSVCSTTAVYSGFWMTPFKYSCCDAARRKRSEMPMMSWPKGCAVARAF